VLQLENLSCSYGKVTALNEVSIVVREGTLVTILGANGAGKSTCLKVISRLINPSAGRILYKGNDITRVRADEAVRRGISQVPEGRMVFPELTVVENLVMGAYHRKDKKAVRDDMERMYSYFPILKERRKQVAATLSGGEQQMLVIARGLMAKPDILLLDEPSLGLAPVLVEAIFSFLTKLKAEGTTILLVEQNAHLSLQIADYAYVLETGSVALEGAAAEMMNNERVKELYLGMTV